MLRRILVVVALLLVVMGLTGCGKHKTGQQVQKPLTAQELALLKKYEALPESTIMALKAKDLVGHTVASASKLQVAGEVMSLMIANGASMASTTQEADLVITAEAHSDGSVHRLTIDVKNGSPFIYEAHLFDTGPYEWTKSKISILGTEHKVQKLAKIQQQYKPAALLPTLTPATPDSRQKPHKLRTRLHLPAPKNGHIEDSPATRWGVFSLCFELLLRYFI